MRPISFWCLAAEIVATVAILIGLFLPADDGENIGLGLLLIVLIVGGAFAYVAAVLATVLLAIVKVITWQEARWPLLVALMASLAIGLAWQQAF